MCVFIQKDWYLWSGYPEYVNNSDVLSGPFNQFCHLHQVLGLDSPPRGICIKWCTMRWLIFWGQIYMTLKVFGLWCVFQSLSTSVIYTDTWRCFVFIPPVSSGAREGSNDIIFLLIGSLFLELSPSWSLRRAMAWLPNQVSLVRLNDLVMDVIFFHLNHGHNRYSWNSQYKA